MALLSTSAASVSARTGLGAMHGGQLTMNARCGRLKGCSARASYRGYAAAWLKEHPYTSRTRASKVDHERKALRQAEISVHSILRDWVKGQVMAIETGILTFDGAFLGQIMLPSGRTVLDEVGHQNILRLEQPNG